MYRTDELLLIEHLTYIPDIPPFFSILKGEGMTVGEFLEKTDMDALDAEVTYTTQMNGDDFRNVFLAMKKNTSITQARIVDAHLDTAYGAGGGISIVVINDGDEPGENGKHEAVVAFRGTAENEWTDDFEGAGQVDSLQQINALEWYKQVYDKYELENYNVTVIGHSKGGNKAKYITILNDTPFRCVSFDGQGFSDNFFDHYRKRIIQRQGIIENHNIDFDYVNILMNDIGEKTYYIGYDYGKFGFTDIPFGKKLLAIDLAFPRDIDPSVGRLPNVRLYNLSDVERRVRENISIRKSEVVRAEAIIEEEIAELQDILRRRKQYLKRAV